MRTTPLEVLASAWRSFRNDSAANEMFSSYDEFLGILDNEEKRLHLERLSQAASKEDPLFQQIRQLGHRFDTSLTSLFFDTAEVSKLTRKYGLF